MPGFLDMLTRAQNSRVDDQRGLLTKEQLEVPSFLQLPTDQVQEPEDPSIASSSTTDSKAKSEDKNSAENSAEAAKEAPDSAKSKSPDMRETTVWKTIMCWMNEDVIKKTTTNISQNCDMINLRKLMQEKISPIALFSNCSQYKLWESGVLPHAALYFWMTFF